MTDVAATTPTSLNRRDMSETNEAPSAPPQTGSATMTKQVSQPQQPSSSNNNNNNSSSSNTSWMKVHVLEGDGVVPHLFNYLFRMDRSMRGRQHALVGPTPTSANPTTGNNNGSGGDVGGSFTNALDVTQGSSAFDLGGTNTSLTMSGAIGQSGIVSSPTTTGDPSLGATAPGERTSAAAPSASPTNATTGGGATKKVLPRYALPIPDTVIYDHNFPQAWFTYTKSPPEMMKKPGKFLDAQHIYKKLCKVESGAGGICAQFSCSVPHPTDPNQPPELMVLYLNPAMLEDLLYSRGTYSNLVKHGILQSFVPPRGSCNDMIEVVWSPKVTVCRRRVNINSLSSRSVSLAHKGATFDGAPDLSLESPANDRVSTELIAMVGTVAENLLKHEHKRVSRLVALFKQDKNCAPWLIHATSVRVEGDKLSGGSLHRLPVNLNPVYQKESTDCPNRYLDEQTKKTVVLRWVGPRKPRGDDETSGTPRYRFTASALARGGANGGTASSGGFHQRRSAQSIDARHAAAMEMGTQGSTGGVAAASIPPEIKMLETFFADTFYALYASRMTMGAKAKPAIITVPLQVEHFLGKKQLDILLISIMQLRRDKNLEDQRELELEAIKTAEIEAETIKQRQQQEEEEKAAAAAAAAGRKMVQSGRSVGTEDDDEDQSMEDMGFTNLSKQETVAPRPTPPPDVMVEEAEPNTPPPKVGGGSSTVEPMDATALLASSPWSPTPTRPAGSASKRSERKPSVQVIVEPEEDADHPAEQKKKSDPLPGSFLTASSHGSSKGIKNWKTLRTLHDASKSLSMKKRRGPRIYVSAGGTGAGGAGSHHQQHLVPLCTVKEQCDLFLADIRATIM